VYADVIIVAVEEVSVAAFYRFYPPPNFAAMRQPLFELGAAEGLRGSVLLASEGVNGTVSGSRSGIQLLLEWIVRQSGMPPIEAKWSACTEHPFGRWKVRLKMEIVALKAESADPCLHPGRYAGPAEWNALLQDPAVTVVDVRNSFELAYGMFPGSVDPGTLDFCEFAEYANSHFQDRSKPIAMYCTGGIRCEKAAAFLAARGYENVTQLHGGILGYLEHVPQDENRWQGACFVFDERVALGPDLKPIG